MGYSIFIIAKDKHLQDKMFSFLDQHMIGFNKLYRNEDDSYFHLRSGVKGNNGISYNGPMKSPTMIGFDFNCSGGERTHMFEILKWMGKKIAKVQSVYYYDGDKEIMRAETIMQSLDKEAHNLFNGSYNQGLDKKKTLEETKRMHANWTLGLHLDGTPEQEDAEIIRVINLIESDIKRLDGLWDSFKE